MNAIRVAQWATGTTGRLALGAVIDSPELELVGVRVHDRAKIGKDAGDLSGRAPTGVRATASTEELISTGADVVLYMGAVERNPDSCFADVTELLAAGIDVITTGSSFIDPRTFDPARAHAIQAACLEAESTFLGVGLFPGFWGEAVAPVLSRLSLRCNTIAVREALSYAGYPSKELIFDVMGYGHPADSTHPTLSDPGQAGRAFAGTASVLAKALGLDIIDTTPFRETALTDVDLHVAAGVIPAGTVGAIKLGLRARCGPIGIVVEHVTWMSPDVAPQWSHHEGYEIAFDGAPTLRCNLVLGTEGEDHTEMGCLATAMHAVHAIPAVHAAPAGLLDLADVAALVGKPA